VAIFDITNEKNPEIGESLKVISYEMVNSSIKIYKNNVHY
jgi:hypothetical protein